MDTYCKHNRKAWSCSLCKREQALTPHTSPSTQVKESLRKIGKLLVGCETGGFPISHMTQGYSRDVTTRVNARSKTYKEVEDTKHLCGLLVSALHKPVTIDEATYIYETILTEILGSRVEFTACPHVHHNERVTFFCHGPARPYKFTHTVEMYDLWKGITRYALHLRACEAAEKPLAKPTPANIVVTLEEGALDRAEITGPCEILFNGVRLRAVREGNTLTLITDDYKKVL